MWSGCSAGYRFLHRHTAGTVQNAATVNSAGDMVIQKANISNTPSFISYNANGTKMEIIAVKASDGTIRTAFDTCQVCLFMVGRGFTLSGIQIGAAAPVSTQNSHFIQTA